MAEQDRQAGERLQALRERKGWSRETLAYHADVSTKTVERIEKGQVEGRRGTIRALAEALEVDEYAILGEPPGPQGVLLSNQVEGGFVEFRAYVADLRREIAELRTEIQKVRVENASALASQTQMLEDIKAVITGLGVPVGTTIQDHLVQTMREERAQIARQRQRPTQS